jgi:hypothetical protein
MNNETENMRAEIEMLQEELRDAQDYIDMTELEIEKAYILIARQKDEIVNLQKELEVCRGVMREQSEDLALAVSRTVP